MLSTRLSIGKLPARLQTRQSPQSQKNLEFTLARTPGSTQPGMVYITANGGISDNRPRSPFRKLSDAFLGLQLQWKAVVVALVAFACRRWLHPNPLVDGRIPAADLSPDKHWKRIVRDATFVRTMTEHLGSKSLSQAWQSEKRKMDRINQDGEMASIDIDVMMNRVDFGGEDGHVAEKGDWSDVKYVQGTRCSTTRSAVTAYFCGADVAENQDVGLGSKRKGYHVGVNTFAEFISCRHQRGERTGTHRRSVYRIGIGCRDALAGYSHAFSIIAQPDGSFFWLQSFIGHYSLQQWMAKTNQDGSPQAHLSLVELQAKLEQVNRLMNITGWTCEANTDYNELFGVDKQKESLAKMSRRSGDSWNPTHRLEFFYWDEACQYPLPTVKPPPPEQRTPSDSVERDLTEYDAECYLEMLQNMLPRAARKGSVGGNAMTRPLTPSVDKDAALGRVDSS